jgi:hypothetical protein
MRPSHSILCDSHQRSPPQLWHDFCPTRPSRWPLISPPSISCPTQILWAETTMPLSARICEAYYASCVSESLPKAAHEAAKVSVSITTHHLMPTVGNHPVTFRTTANISLCDSIFPLSFCVDFISQFYPLICSKRPRRLASLLLVSSVKPCRRFFL